MKIGNYKFKRSTKNPLSVDIERYNYRLINEKVIKTIISCETMEQIQNTIQWVFWVYDIKNADNYSESYSAFLIPLIALMDIKLEEIKK